VTFSSTSGYYEYRHTKIFTQEFQTDVSYSDEKDWGFYMGRVTIFILYGTTEGNGTGILDGNPIEGKSSTRIY